MIIGKQIGLFHIELETTEGTSNVVHLCTAGRQESVGKVQIVYVIPL